MDTGSTDKTKAIAQQFGANVFDFKWIDDFSAARNFALGKATQEWIMMVDADDFIERKTVQSLFEELEDLEDEIALVSLPYVYSQSHANNKNVAYLPRLWKRSLGLNYCYPVHEYLDLSSLEAAQKKRINLPILHRKPKGEFKKKL